jgi:hypothetical protein
MISGILAIKQAAHLAAQNVAKNLADDFYRSKACLRKERLDWLSQAGYGKFIMAGEETLAMISGGVVSADDGESKTHWALYSLTELKAFAAAFEQELECDLAVTPKDRKCPHCGGYVDSPTSYLGRPDKCQECEAEFQSYENEYYHDRIAKLCGWSREAHESGPGRWFRGGATVRVTRDRVLITEFCGLDI